jgi:hypothetical protein
MHGEIHPNSNFYNLCKQPNYSYLALVWGMDYR